MGGVGIRSFATVLGETLIPRTQIADLHGVSPSVFQKWLGDAQLFATSRERGDLALEAARLCLSRAGIDPGVLSAVIASGCSALRLQHEIGASTASALQQSQGCVELLQMLRIAVSLLANPLSGPILVVGVDKFGSDPLRAFGRITDCRMRDLFSDGAAAVLLDRDALQLSLLGFGFASEGRFWNYYELAALGEPPNDIEVMAGSVTMFRAAFDRCLTDARLTRDEVALILFPLEGPLLPLSFARMLRFPLEKIFLFENAPTHVGTSDPVFAIEKLLQSERVPPGQRVLVAARAVGEIRFVAAELAPRPSVP